MRRELGAQSEDDLLHLQEELLSGRTKPAARATRVKRKGHGKAVPDAVMEDPVPAMESTASTGTTVLGQIVERDTSGCHSFAIPPLQATSSPFPEVMNRRSSKFALRRKVGKKNPSANHSVGKMGSETKHTSSAHEGDDGSIDEENSSKLAGMSHKQILEAQRDLKSRISPATLKFLAKRGANKTSKPPETGPDTTTVVDLASSSSEANQDANSHLSKSATTDLPQRKYHPDCACLRFNLDGNTVSMLSSEEWNSKASPIERALERDALRQDEHGTFSDGYTLEEWSILGRSQFVGHRSMAMVALTAIMKTARPSVLNVKSGWKYQAHAICLPEGVVLSEDALWDKIWAHALKEIDVGGLALEALKCGTSSVVSGAVKLLVALCGMPIAEEAVCEACDSDPMGGWPIIPLVPVVRPGPGGVWEAYPATDENSLQGPIKGSLLQKLVERGLLDQFSRLLELGTLPNLLVMVLPVLLACGRSGIDLIMAVIQSKPILTAFKEALNPCPLEENLNTSWETTYQVLKVVRVLAQYGPKVLQSLKTQGILEIAKQLLFSLWMGNDLKAFDKANDKYHLALKVESLRIWRVCSLNGITLASVTDIFPCICKYFCAPDIPDSGHNPYTKVGLAKSYLLSKEIYLAVTFGLMQALASESSSTSTNPAAAYAPLLSEAKLWLEKGSLSKVAALWQSSIQSDGWDLHPDVTASQMLPFSIPSIGYVTVGALCAVTGFVINCYHLNPQLLTRDWVGQSVLQLTDLLVEKITIKHILKGCERQMNGLPCLDWRSKVCASLAASIMWAANISGDASKSSPLICLLLDGIHTSIVDQDQSSELPHSLDEPLLSQLQSCTYVSKLVVNLLQACASTVTQSGSPLSTATGTEHHAADIGVHLLTMLPPGFETWGLRVLTSITSMALLEPIMHSGIEKAAGILCTNPTLSKNVEVYQATASPTAELDLAALSNSLQTSYAASWLSLIPADAVKQNVKVSLAPSFESRGLYLEPSSIDFLAGSRLPLPFGWPLMEAYCVPGPNFVLDSSHNPVCGAILFALGLESSKSKSLARISIGSKHRSLIQLVYLTQLDELCPGELGRSEVWQDDWVRKGLAALSHIYWSQMQDKGQVLSSHVNKKFVSQILDKFTSSSFGDPLFGVHVALLLQSGGDEEVIKWVWQGLDECDALELLPNIEYWSGGLAGHGRVLVSQSTFDYIKSIVDSSKSELLLGSWVMDYFKALNATN